MAFDEQRPMVQGNWTCSECGAEITELPFEPTGDRPLFCRDCHSKRMDSRRPRGGGNFRRERRMFQGNWKCAGCGCEITELPFEPKDGSEVYCRDCYRKNREEN